MKSTVKPSWIAIGLFLPLAAVLATMFACLPAPVGDPEKSKVDDKLLGEWQPAKADSPDEKDLILMRKWDDHTYALMTFMSKTTDGKTERASDTYKGWLASLGGGTFLVLEPMDSPPGEKMFWVVLRLEPKGDSMDLRLVKPDSDWMKALGEKPTRADEEKVITAHVNDDALYGDKITYNKVPEDKVKDLMKEVQGK